MEKYLKVFAASTIIFGITFLTKYGLVGGLIAGALIGLAVCAMAYLNDQLSAKKSISVSTLLTIIPILGLPWAFAIFWYSLTVRHLIFDRAIILGLFSCVGLGLMIFGISLAVCKYRSNIELSWKRIITVIVGSYVFYVLGIFAVFYTWSIGIPAVVCIVFTISFIILFAALIYKLTDKLSYQVNH